MQKIVQALPLKRCLHDHRVMLTSLEIAHRLREALDRSGKSASDLARECGVTPQAVYGWINTGRVSKGRLPAISAALGVSVEQLVGVDGDSPPVTQSVKTEQSDAILDGYVTVPGFLPARADEFTLVPRLDARGSCGGGADNGDEPLELEPLAFRNEWLRGKGARDPVVIDARGDSMSPFIVHGDVILFDRAKTTVVSGQIYLVQTPDGLRVKRVHREFDGSITLRSDNADKVRFPDERVPADLVPQLVVVGSFVWRGGG